MKRLVAFLLAGMLSLAVGGVPQAGAAGEGPPPPWHEKLEASLSGLVTPPSGKAATTSSSKKYQEGAYQLVTGQGKDKVLSIKKDKDGRDLVDVLINTDGSLSGFVDLATSVSSGGNSQIKAAQGGQEGTATVTATPPLLQSIAVSPSAASIPKGGAQQFSAVGTLTDGTTGNLTNTAAWNSSNTSVATVNASGLATGLNPGTSQIKASQSGKEGVATLTVSGEATVQGRVILQGRSNHSGAAVFFTGQNPVITDASGNFQLQLPTGTYGVRVEKDGFLRAAKSGLVVSQDLVLPLVTLSAGDVNGDGVIDVRDLSLGGGNLGKSQSPWP